MPFLGLLELLPNPLAHVLLMVKLRREPFSDGQTAVPKESIMKAVTVEIITDYI